MNQTTSGFAYIIKSVDLRHGKLSHVNFASIERLKYVRLISTVNIDDFTKCFVCIEAKYAKTVFKSITSRQTKLLELAHS